MREPKQLILQFRIEGHGSVDDFDRVVEMEDKLDSALRRNRSGHVDGHDMGSGEMNIFIFVKTREYGSWFMNQYLKNQPWGKESILAKRNRDETYEVIWPKDFTGEFKIT